MYAVSGSTATSIGTYTVYNWYLAGFVASKVRHLGPDAGGQLRGRHPELYLMATLTLFDVGACNCPVVGCAAYPCTLPASNLYLSAVSGGNDGGLSSMAP